MSFRGVRICSFTDRYDYRIVVDGITYRFEFSERFGPALLGKRGQLLRDGRFLIDARDRHPFWKGFNPWLDQGKRVDHWTGLCIWHEPKPQIVRRIAGNNWKIVENGERYGKTIYLEPGDPLPGRISSIVPHDERPR